MHGLSSALMQGLGRCDVRYNRVVVSTPRIDQTLDIRGEVCPYTFVKTKLALEEMQSGRVLCVLVDYEPATRSVPRSVTLQGDEVLAVSATRSDAWQILIRKA